MPHANMPNIKQDEFDFPNLEKFTLTKGEKPKILLLYGSLRKRSFSRLVIEEAQLILETLGAEVRIYNPENLPLVDSVEDSHPEVQKFREWVIWSEGMVWCSPERHGAMTAVFKNQIDWIPLSMGRYDRLKERL